MNNKLYSLQSIQIQKCFNLNNIGTFDLMYNNNYSESKLFSWEFKKPICMQIKKNSFYTKNFMVYFYNVNLGIIKVI